MDENVGGLVNDAVGFATRAVHFDKEGKHDVAIYYYQQAARLLQHAVNSSGESQNCDNLLAKVKEYSDRANALQRATAATAKCNAQKPQGQSELERAYFLLSQGLDEDEVGNSEEALELYAQSVELCLTARKNTEDTELQGKLTRLAEQTLERAELLKGIAPQELQASRQMGSSTNAPTPSTQDTVAPLLRNLNLNDNKREGKRPPLHRGSSAHLKVVGNDSYTDEEKQVLRMTSIINGREYVPFMSVDLKERFAYPIPFGDRDGKLLLSPKQKASFARWARPEDLSSSPKMIELIDCFSIKQTVVSDCSFVASLAVSALYEKRFDKRVITSIIYPRNRNGDPVYNPCGKYMVKLHINGVPRKVIIDDTLPMGHHGELLCSYSTNRNELWISLLEKAYMKVMGGYNFPGSNSNIDLHALTGWIPERETIRLNDPTFNKDGLFKKLHNRHREGDVLLTVATGDLSEADAERAGLVPTHAYAVLDVREVNGVHLFLLKNPWSHMRWRGNYSELDTVHWTPEMKKLLHFDPNSASMFDNGVFWIDYESVCRFFDVFYMNWNPGLFSYTYCIHQSWKAGLGPVKDAYNIGDNPQYSLEIRASHPSAVWILLTRHITELEDFKENREYITTLVYKNEGKKVYYPYDPPPYIDGVRINSPHYLCKINASEAGTFRYTVVVSQYEKTNTIHYTLRAYSSCPFSMRKIGNPFKHKKEITNGQWSGQSAGGCANNPQTYPMNPCYQVTLEASGNDHHLLVDLKGPKQYQVGFDIVCVVANDEQAKSYFKKKSSGAYRSGFAIMDLEDVPSGTYNIIPCTFLPGQEGPFFLTIQASCKFCLSKLQ